MRLGYDTERLAAVCERLARAVMQDLRRAVKQRHGLASVSPLHAGVMVVVQRFRTVQKLMGHSNIAVTSVYLHCLPGAEQAAASKLDTLLEN